MASQLNKAGITSSKQSRRRTASQRLAIARLIKLVELIVAESGYPERFDARMWIRAWLLEPNPALDNRKPAALMNTKAGQEMIFSLILKMQSGAYA
jgi:uncharacterized protein (DUF2384 family)